MRSIMCMFQCWTRRGKRSSLPCGSSTCGRATASCSSTPSQTSPASTTSQTFMHRSSASKTSTLSPLNNLHLGNALNESEAPTNAESMLHQTPFKHRSSASKTSRFSPLYNLHVGNALNDQCGKHVTSNNFHAQILRVKDKYALYKCFSISINAKSNAIKCLQIYKTRAIFVKSGRGPGSLF